MQRGHRGVMVPKPEGLYCHCSSSRKTQVHPREDGCPSAADSSGKPGLRGIRGRGGLEVGMGEQKTPCADLRPTPGRAADSGSCLLQCRGLREPVSG